MSGFARGEARHVAGRIVRALAGVAGFDVVRRGAAAEPVHPLSAPATVRAEDEIVPRGRTERFETDEYDVLPKGRYDIVERNYYSPVPCLELLPDDIFDRRSVLGGVDLAGEAAMASVESDLAPYVPELADIAIEGPRSAGEFFLRDMNYESVDAELLYAMVRAVKPGRVIELGSGYTTLLINRAVRVNAIEGVVTDHIAYDPYPRDFIVGDIVADGAPEGTRFEPVPATHVPFEVFEELQRGDVVFVDTTHTVKLGSDVNHIILDVLPRLRSGVLVHFHDIFLPFEYPRAWFTEFQYLWAEQYLLQAFLAYNASFEVVLPTQLLARDFSERLGAVVPSFAPGVSPGAFWLRRR